MYKVILPSLVALAVGLKEFKPIDLVPIDDYSKVIDPSCQDGVNNVIKLANTGIHDIEINGLVIHTYDAEFNPSCSQGRAKISLPGIISLAKGKIIVHKALDLEHMRKLRLQYTLKGSKGSVCSNGHPSFWRLFPAKNPCRYDVSAAIKKLPLRLYRMLSKPGTYDLEEVVEAGGITTIIPMRHFHPEANGHWEVGVSLADGEKNHILASIAPRGMIHINN